MLDFSECVIVIVIVSWCYAKALNETDRRPWTSNALMRRSTRGDIFWQRRAAASKSSLKTNSADHCFHCWTPKSTMRLFALSDCVRHRTMRRAAYEWVKLKCERFLGDVHSLNHIWESIRFEKRPWLTELVLDQTRYTMQAHLPSRWVQLAPLQKHARPPEWSLEVSKTMSDSEESSKRATSWSSPPAISKSAMIISTASTARTMALRCYGGRPSAAMDALSPDSADSVHQCEESGDGVTADLFNSCVKQIGPVQEDLAVTSIRMQVPRIEQRRRCMRDAELID